jgi:hypothetical protein
MRLGKSWRPQSIYGQEGGSNDLVNQRLLGEVHLDPFDVSHTKDDILWLGDEEEEVERYLLNACKEYRETARKMRKGKVDEEFNICRSGQAECRRHEWPVVSRACSCFG